MLPYKISASIHIKSGEVIHNGTAIFRDTSRSEGNQFLKKAYKGLDVHYPKFFKMDRLSKLAFLASDVLLRARFRESEPNQDIALVFSNRAASLDTDRKHQDTISNSEDYYPSPAIFVYTLPNICLGEISIRHKLHSENSFFIFDAFEAGYLHQYASSLIQGNKASEVLCGWVDYDKDVYEAFLYLVAPTGDIKHTPEEIKRLYKRL